MFRNVTLKCLTEIAGVSVNQYEEQFVNLFTLTMSQLKQVHTQIHWISLGYIYILLWTHWSDQSVHIKAGFVLSFCTDVASEHKYQAGLFQWEGRWAEFYPEPQPVPLHLPQRARPAHREETQPARDADGGETPHIRWSGTSPNSQLLVSYFSFWCVLMAQLFTSQCGCI